MKRSQEIDRTTAETLTFLLHSQNKKLQKLEQESAKLRRGDRVAVGVA
jgi:hypothetical protein